SVPWQNHWPLKPDVVFEGGNVAADGIGAVWTPSLSLLTAAHDTTKRLFSTINATSAATALATRLLAQVEAAYPHQWPETYRALLVHSARWTESMRKRFLPNENKTSYRELVRRCGYGLPSVDDALWSTRNSLTLIAQQEIQPFLKDPGKTYATANSMHLFELPWPKEELEALGEV